MRTRAVKALKIFCPIEPQTLGSLLAGDVTALDHDPTLSKMLGVIRGETALGDFGLYTSVVELACGWELFTPGAAAQPTLGKAGLPATSPTAVLTIYIAEDAPAEALDRALDAIIAVHPWEVPVIELSTTMLVERNTPMPVVE